MRELIIAPQTNRLCANQEIEIREEITALKFFVQIKKECVTVDSKVLSLGVYMLFGGQDVIGDRPLSHECVLKVK